MNAIQRNTIEKMRADGMSYSIIAKALEYEGSHSQKALSAQPDIRSGLIMMRLKPRSGN